MCHGRPMKYKAAIRAIRDLECRRDRRRHPQIETRRTENTSKRRAAVSALSIQQLAVSIADCDAQRPQGARPLHDAAYCEEVRRRLDTEPLQSVEIAARIPPRPTRSATFHAGCTRCFRGGRHGLRCAEEGRRHQIGERSASSPRVHGFSSTMRQSTSISVTATIRHGIKLPTTCNVH